MSWFKHAFAVDPPGPAEPNDTQRQLVDTLCAEIVRRQLTVPAVLFLEMSRPLNHASAQLLHFLAPIATIAVDAGSYQHIAQFLERRGSVDYILQRLECIEATHKPPRKSAGSPGDTRDEVRGR